MHTRRRALPILAVLLLVTPPDAAAQSPAATPSSVPAAKPEDVASIDAIINALYASISGPAGHARDWNRLRPLFLPEARMIPVGKRPTGEAKLRVLGVGDYIATSGPVIEKRIPPTRDQPPRGTLRHHRPSLQHLRSAHGKRADTNARHQQPATDTRRPALVDRFADVAGRDARPAAAQ